MNKIRAFTLIELLIVIGILAALATITLLVINPAQLVKQSRDANRITELNQINRALLLFQGFGGSAAAMGTHGTVYVSLPATNSDCSDLSLPALGGGYVYACSTSANYRNIDGTGWIPVDLTSIQSQAGTLFANLPIDPVNTVTNGYYYTYVPGSWALSATMESDKYIADNAVNDGGQSSTRFETGNELTLNSNLGTDTNTVCGNNTKEGSEVCDGTDLNSQTCVTQLGVGYTGTLSCNAGCSAFVTSSCVAPWACGDTLTDSRNSKTYSTVLIGTQCWFTQNLDYDDGVCSTKTWVNNTDVGWCGYYTGGPFANEGILYQWSAAMNGSTTPGAQGLCPTGWHIPTHDEWTTLERTVCTSGSCATDFPFNTTTYGWKGTNEGTKLKVGGSSGFNAVLAGYRSLDGTFANRSVYGHLWASSQNTTNGWLRLFGSDQNNVNRDYTYKAYGLAVRCIKD